MPPVNTDGLLDYTIPSGSVSLSAYCNALKVWKDPLVALAMVTLELHVPRSLRDGLWVLQTSRRLAFRYRHYGYGIIRSILMDLMICELSFS